MKKLLCCAVLLAAVAAQAQSAELFGGYSYVRLPSTGGTATHLNLNGWNGAGTLKYGWFGVTADFSGAYATPNIASIDVRVRQHNYLFGPHVAVRVLGVSPFAHALFGASRISTAVGSASASETSFATALGGGVDVNFLPRVAFRLVQADYLQTRYGDGRQDNFRYSGGIVLRF